MKPNLQLPRHFLVFLLLSLFAVAQLGWWIIFQVNEGARIERVQNDIWRQQIETASVWRANHDSAPQIYQAWLAENFPDLSLLPDGSKLQISTEARKRLDQIADGRVRMFISEGIFFSLLLFLGVGYMYRMMRHEITFEQRQSMFLAATSHELKTPITSLRLYLDTLRDRELPQQQKTELIETMQKDLQRLTSLIERLLQAQALAGNKSKVVLQVTDLTEETRVVLEQVAGMFDLKGFSLRTHLDPDIRVMADPEQWQVVLRNLLENAFRYSPNGGTISVRLARAGQSAQLEISDQGIGLDRMESERVFDRFYRAGNEDTRRTSGTGLGLHLVRGIVESFAGKVSVHSEGPGKGSTFCVEIPLVEERSDG